jgi:hypothetical protein
LLTFGGVGLLNVLGVPIWPLPTNVKQQVLTTEPFAVSQQPQPQTETLRISFYLVNDNFCHCNQSKAPHPKELLFTDPRFRTKPRIAVAANQIDQAKSENNRSNGCQLFVDEH